jgi:2-dehydropantoate 2-reductase
VACAATIERSPAILPGNEFKEACAMKVCIYGAGAIGGHLAVRFAKGGASVSVVARGAHLDAIRHNGLRMVAPAEETVVDVTATDKPGDLGPQDVVIVAVKAPGLASVAEGIRPLLHANTPVVFMMNGIPWWYFYRHGGPQDGHDIPVLDPGGVVRQAIGFERAIGGVVYSACTVIKPGVVQVDHLHNRFVLGEPGGQLSDRLSALVEPLRSGGVTVELSEAIRDAVWSKLLLNLGMGPLGVLTGSAPRDFFIEDACKDATRAVVAEAAAIAEAMGCSVSPNAEGQIRNGSKSNHKTSILQDLTLGRPMEIDALYTVPLQMAREAGVATPVLDLLVALTRARARAAGLYAG